MTEDETTAPRPKPRLRGVAHVVGAVLAVPAVYVMVRHARSGPAESAALVYGLSTVLLLSVSAIYHTPMWLPETRMKLRRLDRSAIYLLIAGSYMPVCLAIGGQTGRILAIVVWSGAAVGLSMAIGWIKAPRAATAIPYVLLGWAIVPFVGDLYRNIGIVSFALFACGGLLYTVGALVYARRRPDPVPAVFGYHEIFHVLVLVACATHYAAVWRIVT